MSMRLTDIELEIMAILWHSKTPMTSAEIVEASNDRTWKENSIHVLMKSLTKKGAVVLSDPKPTSTNIARAYMPALSAVDYMISTIRDILKRSKIGIHIDQKMLIKGIIEMEEG